MIEEINEMCDKYIDKKEIKMFLLEYIKKYYNKSLLNFAKSYSKIFKLKKRYKIEHSIEQIKKYNRIYIRRDNLIVTYKSFMFLGLILNAKFYF